MKSHGNRLRRASGEGGEGGKEINIKPRQKHDEA